MASKKLTTQQADIRRHLLYRLAQRTETSDHSEPIRPADFGQVERIPFVTTKADRRTVVFRGKAKAVIPEEKRRFNAAARDPKNKDHKDYPVIDIL